MKGEEDLETMLEAISLDSLINFCPVVSPCLTLKTWLSGPPR